MRFRRDVKKAINRGKDMVKLYTVVEKLTNDEPLEPKHRDHSLSGDYEGHRECHIEPDWLLIYRLPDETLLILVSTGTHSDLFG
jgi:mRNA interferase YafQ